MIQSWSQIPREDFANTQVPCRPTENVRVHINLAAPAREERFIPDAGISCSTNTWNVAALCYSVFVVQFVPQERLMCSCMITRLCMQSQTNTFESYRSILVCTYMYVHACTASVSNFRCASSTRAKRKVTTGRSNITTNKMSLSSLPWPFYLGCSNLCRYKSPWTIDTSNELMMVSRLDFGRVSEEGINALIRSFHATCVTHSQCSEHRFVAFHSDKNAYLRMKIGLGEQWYRKLEPRPRHFTKPQSILPFLLH